MSDEPNTKTPEQLRQHKAWRKWYDSDKGKAYRDKIKATRKLKGDPPAPEQVDPPQ